MILMFQDDYLLMNYSDSDAADGIKFDYVPQEIYLKTNIINFPLFSNLLFLYLACNANP